MLESSYLKEQFEKEYSREEWSKILREIFNATLLAKPKNLELKRNEWDATGYELGSFETLEGRQVGIFEIDVPRKAKLQHNRKGLRDLLKNEVYRDQVDAALLVFKQDKKWRFSYVSQIRVYNKDTGKRELKVTEPKRYTYLMGEGERCLTAAKQFAKIQMDTNLFGKGVTLETIHNAFSVEKMSKEFFDEYRRQYGLFTAFLTGYDETNKEKNPASGFLRSAFSNDTKAARDFVKKTLGRIVFLYFLEKKGWLGVQQGEKWGKGDDNFLSNLYRDCKQKGNFYSDVLVPLFFRTLNRERADSLFDIRPDIFTNPAYSTVKVPYLNGGLFEEDRVGATLLTFPQHLFKGLFDFFDQYNFTVYEDSPDEHTVAVDPEMLGHIFENLLEDNKDKGTYYTPKEIVHYMCQESLIEYLCTKLEGSAERRDIERFIKHQEAGGVAGYTEEILQALFDVKICDPAIGSGAFPMGLLMEILHAVETMYYLNPDVAEKIWNIKDWEPGKVKAEIIQNSIYGVDIEQGAVDIARLRFWLSLVVDEEVKHGENPKPLPNLDYKIVVGNSLVSKFEEQVIEIDWNLTIKGNTINDAVKNIQKQQKVVHKKLKSLFENQLSYFDYEGDKSSLKEAIRLLKIDVLIEQIQLNIERNNLNTSQGSLFDTDSKSRKKAVENMAARMALESAIIKLNRLKIRAGAPLHFFDWKLDFPEIMNEEIAKSETGFDIIIGNPPYVKEYTNRAAFEGIPYYQGKMDIWYSFACYGLDPLLKKEGVLTFIATNNWVTNAGASLMRDKVINDTRILKMIDFGSYMIFESASIQTMIMMFKNQSETDNYQFDYRKVIGKSKDFGEIVDLLSLSRTDRTVFLNPVIQKERYRNKFLVFGESSIEEILDNIEEKCNFSLDKRDEVAQGIVAPQDFVNKKSAEALGDMSLKGEGIFIITNAERRGLNLSVEEKALVKRFYTTEELTKYYGDRTNKLWVIYTDSSFKNPRTIRPFPNIKGHLDRFTNVITSDNAPYGLHRSRDEYFFQGEKIISLRKCEYPTFTYTDFDCYVSQTFYVIKTERTDMKYLTGLLNSKLVAFWLRHKGKMQGAQFQVDKEPILEIPIYIPSNPAPVITLVEKIISGKAEGKNTESQERKIDRLIYRLYELTYDEASIIEGNTEWMSREDYEKQP